MYGRIAVKLLVVLAVLALLAAPATAAEVFRGSIKEVKDGKLTIAVATSDDTPAEDMMFTVSEDARITLDGKEAKLTDLKAGQKCNVAADQNDQGGWVAKVVTAAAADKPERDR